MDRPDLPEDYYDALSAAEAAVVVKDWRIAELERVKENLTGQALEEVARREQAEARTAELEDEQKLWRKQGVALNERFRALLDALTGEEALTMACASLKYRYGRVWGSDMGDAIRAAKDAALAATEKEKP